MSDELITLTASIVASYVENNTISPTDLPALIAATFGALSGAGTPAVPEAEVTTKATPAQIRKSITPDAIISFEDGRTYKSMKRHLALRGLTPQDYRAKWGLPKDYPMVSPAYSAARSALAKASGLGAGGRGAVPVVPAAPPEPMKAPEPAKAAKAQKAKAVKAGPGVSVRKAKVGRPPTAIDPATDDFT